MIVIPQDGKHAEACAQCPEYGCDPFYVDVSSTKDALNDIVTREQHDIGCRLVCDSDDAANLAFTDIWRARVQIAQDSNPERRHVSRVWTIEDDAVSDDVDAGWLDPERVGRKRDPGEQRKPPRYPPDGFRPISHEPEL
jgi:hypothetical protein